MKIMSRKTGILFIQMHRPFYTHSGGTFANYCQFDRLMGFPAQRRMPGQSC
jgi:hypothetical protein